MSNTNTEKVVPTPRLDLAKHAGPAYQAMMRFSQAVEGLGLERSLIHLIETRASQINHCAFCIDMHTHDAVSAGEDHQRLHALGAWRETPFFTARERAALAYTEEATLIADEGVPDEVFDELSEHFDESEVGAVIWVVALINTWNRIAIPARIPPGAYRAGHYEEGTS